MQLPIKLVGKGHTKDARQSSDREEQTRMAKILQNPPQIITHSITEGNICVLPPPTATQASITSLRLCQAGERAEYIPTSVLISDRFGQFLPSARP